LINLHGETLSVIRLTTANITCQHFSLQMNLYQQLVGTDYHC